MIETIEKPELETIVPRELVEAILEMARPGTLKDEDISREFFIRGIRAMDCSAFATIQTMTTVADSSLVKPKSNGISGAIQKLGVSQVCVNVSYENMVNNKIGKLTPIGETIAKMFEAAPRTWGQRVIVDGKTRGLVEHKGKVYLDVAHLRNLKGSQYFLRGEPVDYETIKEFFHERKESQRQPLPEDQKIKWRTIDVANIVGITITPNRYPRITYRYRLHD